MHARLFFWIPIFVFWIAALAAIFIYDRVTLHLLLNALHHPIANKFFLYTTHLGGGIAVSAALLFAYVKNRNLFFELLLGYSFAIATVALFKYFIWPNAPRPTALIDGLTLVPGFVNDASRTFPSGHTTTIFCMGTLFQHYLKKSWQKCAIAIGCILVGYSRVYLSQHFTIDVLVGAMLGVLGAVFGQTLLKFTKHKPYIQKFLP